MDPPEIRSRLRKFKADFSSVLSGWADVGNAAFLRFQRRFVDDEDYIAAFYRRLQLEQAAPDVHVERHGLFTPASALAALRMHPYRHLQLEPLTSSSADTCTLHFGRGLHPSRVEDRGGSRTGNGTGVQVAVWRGLTRDTGHFSVVGTVARWLSEARSGRIPADYGFLNSSTTAAGSFSVLAKNVTTCQVCVSFNVFFHAGIPVQRMPC